MTIKAMNTHGGLANHRDQPNRFSTKAVPSAPSTPSIATGRNGEKYTPQRASSCGMITSVFPFSFRSSG